jgi:hypothetical protein
MRFKLTNFTPNLNRFGKSSKMEKGESSTANASNKGKGKKPTDGAGPSSAGGRSSRASSSSRTESFLSDTSSESRDILNRFDSPEAYLKHMAEKEKSRAENLASEKKDDARIIKKNTKEAVKSSKKLLASIKKETAKTNAHVKKEMAKIDKAQAKAVKEHAKAERKLAKEEARLNKEGKLSERQKQEAKRKYESDLEAEIAASAPPESSHSSSPSSNSEDLRRAWTSYPSPGNRAEARPIASRSDSPGSSIRTARTLPESSSASLGHSVPRSPDRPDGNGSVSHFEGRPVPLEHPGHVEINTPGTVVESPHTSHQEQGLGSSEHGSSGTSNLRNTD